MTAGGLLVRSQLRFFWRSPWSTVTVLLGVALGVASVVAVHQVNVRVNASLAAATPVHLAGITHLLERPSGPLGKTTADDYFELRRAWRAGALPGVSALIPVVEGHIVHAGRRTQVFATDWLAASGLQSQQDLRGVSLLGRDAVIADAMLELPVGSSLTIGGVDYAVAATVDSGLGPALFVDIGALGAIPARSTTSPWRGATCLPG